MLDDSWLRWNISNVRDCSSVGAIHQMGARVPVGPRASS